MEKLMKKGQIDEFAFVLAAGVIVIVMLMVAFTTPSESLPTISPSTVSLSLQSGTSGNFNLVISGMVTNVTLSASGNIASWLQFDTAAIDSIKDSATVRVRVNVPSTATQGTHTGSVIVKSTGGQKTVPVTVNVVVTPILASRTIPLPDISVRFTPNQKTMDSKENFEVSQGSFSGQSATLIASVEDVELASITGGSIQLLIEDTNSLGNLIVTVNGKEVYNQKPSPGIVDISIDKSLITKFTSVKIQASSPGLQFWASTVYKIRSAKLLFNFQSVSAVSATFNLNDLEISNFDYFQFSARVKDYSTPIQPLLISVNGQLVYWEIPTIPFVSKIFSRDIQGNNLFLTSNNTISFNLEKEAFLDLTNVVLIVFYKSF